MKKYLLIVLLACVLIPSASFAREEKLSLMINGIYIFDGAPPVIINEKTYIPLRNLFENINFTVEYYPEYKSALAWYNNGEFKIAFTIGSNIVTIYSNYTNGSSADINISDKAIMYNGSVYVPFRAFGELLGANVLYDKYAYTVLLTVNDQQVKSTIYPYINISTSETESKTDNILNAKEIAQLSNRVGYVEVYNNHEDIIASGSGFVLEGGLFITNHHVVEDGLGMIVNINNSIYDNNGWYLFDNSITDIFGTILSTSYDINGKPTGKIPEEFFYANTTLPEVGDKIYAIGSPYGLENTLSEGIVSGVRNINGVQYIQHTATIESGSSGGVLLNEFGEVIGINTWKIEDSALYFSVPIRYVFDEINKL